jgi:hypothetical protein
MSKGPTSGTRRNLTSAGMSALRTGSSRILGVALIVTSVLLFTVAFATGFLPFELASLVAFVLGVALLAVELEPRVRLALAADGMLGYIRSQESAFRALKATGKATYIPYGNQAKMAVARDDGGSTLEFPAVGTGLFDELVGELGEFSEKGLEFFKIWIPKTLMDNLSASDDVKVSGDGGNVEVTMSKPFVRRLCVDPFVTANVCCRMGCPLAGGVAQALAVTTGKEVRFEKCTYDPKTQKANTSLILGKSG